MNNTSRLLPIEDTITSAWIRVKGAKSSILGAYCLILFISFGFHFLNTLLKEYSLDIVLTLINYILNFLFGMGIMYIGIQRAFNLPISYGLMFDVFELRIAMRLIGAFIIKQLIFFSISIPALVISFGLVTASKETSFLDFAVIFSVLFFLFLFFIAIYINVRLSLSYGFIIQQKTDLMSSLKLSWEVTNQNFWRIVLTMLILYFILILSAIPLGIGLIWTLPLIIIGYGMIYKNLAITK